MGGNNSYNKSLGGIHESNRTHKDTGQRVDGHKVLVQKKSPYQAKVPMNSNSDSPIYLCARNIKGKEGKYEIGYIGIYKNHKIVGQIDLVIDKNGNVKPYTSDGKGTHYHKFKESEGGTMGRKSRAKDNHLPIPKQYQSLLNKVIEYNKRQRK